MIWQDPPPYVQYMAEAERLTRLSAAVNICPTFGFVADMAALDRTLGNYDRRVILAGVGGPVLDRHMSETADRVLAEVRLFASDLGGDHSDLAVEYFADLCADAVIDYPAVMSLPED